MRIVALAGGVGGAKLASGLQAALPAGCLTVVVNTGDDFEHWGMSICPDLDTVLYNLAQVHNPETGWGRRDEGWNVLHEIEHFGGENWFRIGDRDLALHLRRTEWLRMCSGGPHRAVFDPLLVRPLDDAVDVDAGRVDHVRV